MDKTYKNMTKRKTHQGKAMVWTKPQTRDLLMQIKFNIRIKSLDRVIMKLAKREIEVPDQIIEDNEKWFNTN